MKYWIETIWQSSRSLAKTQCYNWENLHLLDKKRQTENWPCCLELINHSSSGLSNCRTQLDNRKTSRFPRQNESSLQRFSMSNLEWQSYENLCGREWMKYVLPKELSRSGVLRPGSLTKLVILVLNGNASLDSFQIRHLEVTLCRESAKIIKFWLCWLGFQCACETQNGLGRWQNEPILKKFFS